MDPQDELLQIEKALEEFIKKYGGQYICTVIWPGTPAKKGSSHVRIMESELYDQAIDALKNRLR